MTDQPPKEIPLSYILTPQEHYFSGGSPGESPDPYTPVGVYGVPWDPESKFSLEEIIHERKRRGTFTNYIIGHALGIKGAAVISLPELDLDGKTKEDPKILGYLDPETEQVITYPDRDLTKEFLEINKKSGIEIPMREGEPPRDISKL